ncbi:hypothetical protein KUCAC02_035476, partial [Chaenocephalus aceratus]
DSSSSFLSFSFWESLSHRAVLRFRKQDALIRRGLGDKDALSIRQQKHGRDQTSSSLIGQELEVVSVLQREGRKQKRGIQNISLCPENIRNDTPADSQGK